MNHARATRRNPTVSNAVLFGAGTSAALVLRAAPPVERAVVLPAVVRTPAIRTLHVVGAGVVRGNRIGADRAT